MAIKNQREQLMHTMLWQITIILLVLIVSWMYVIPLSQQLSDSVWATNAIIEEFTHTYNDGIPYTELGSILQKTKWKEELLAIIQSAPKETQNVILKSGSEPYLTWLNTAIGESTSDKKKLTLKKSRLNSILPTLNPISNNLTEETVSMRKYMAFIEENIIKKFGIESTTALGIQTINYGKKWGTMPEAIGSFDTEINFVSTNIGIANMIDYVNKLGHYEILLDTGSTNADTPGIMSNPLTMIDSLSLQNTLDLNKPTDVNSGRMTIRFYIRGSSITDIAYLSETLKSRKIELGKKIDASIALCENNNTCPQKKNLAALSRKYNEFTRATSSSVPKQGTEMIYILSSQLDSIIALEKEMLNITK